MVAKEKTGVKKEGDGEVLFDSSSVFPEFLKQRKERMGGRARGERPKAGAREEL